TFFTHCPSHLPALHSFPTRRSSDLAIRGAEVEVDERVHDPESLADPLIAKLHRSAARKRFETFQFPVRPCHARRGVSTLRRPQRSEEHTSELQSRENLVCRLLLEKQ